jgi:predicted enzyme related to lactoylglutathione lyase
MHGQFCWYELTTPDVEAAKKFYPRFTGWGTQAFDNDYTMFTTGGAPAAGIFRLSDEMRRQGVPPNWMPYVEADNVDGMANRAVALGGAVVVPPKDIPGTGRFAVLRDPQGATFGVYKSVRASGGWDGKAVVGGFSWHELMTTDYQKAFEFYQALFGWDKQGEMDMGGGAMYLMYGKGGAMYGGMYTAPPEMAGMHPFWLVYIHVKDVEKAVETATKAGAFVQRERMEIPGGTIAILGDPQGAGFAVHDTNAMPAPAQPAPGAAVKKAVKKAAKKAAKRVAKAVTAVRETVKTAVKKATKKRAKASVRSKPKARPKARKAAPKRKTASRAKAKARPRKAARKASRSKSRSRTRRASRR